MDLEINNTNYKLDVLGAINAGKLVEVGPVRKIGQCYTEEQDDGTTLVLLVAEVDCVVGVKKVALIDIASGCCYAGQFQVKDEYRITEEEWDHISAGNDQFLTLVETVLKVK